MKHKEFNLIQKLISNAIKACISRTAGRTAHGDNTLNILLTNLAEKARRQIYLPSYKWVLDNRVQDLIHELQKLVAEKTVVLLDYETNSEIDNLSRPLSHACLIQLYLEGDWPT